MTGLRIDYDSEKMIWFIESPIVLSHIMKIRVMNYCKKQISFRINGEKGGERRKRMMNALARMTPENLECRLVGQGEKTIYIAPGIKL